MTTTVIVNAYCPPDKEVLISTVNSTVPDTILQNGETHTRVVYDHQQVQVMEIDKK